MKSEKTAEAKFKNDIMKIVREVKLVSSRWSKRSDTRPDRKDFTTRMRAFILVGNLRSNLRHCLLQIRTILYSLPQLWGMFKSTLVPDETRFQTFQPLPLNSFGRSSLACPFEELYSSEGAVSSFVSEEKLEVMFDSIRLFHNLYEANKKGKRSAYGL
ncbi:hypothetical protein RUM44_008328 [Polyplax serrata]|uniref:Uncharacterized protein n=1 Tax=Polyplax serrata TaxID=468196 RepID=A0ABR1B819_POLSC